MKFILVVILLIVTSIFSTSHQAVNDTPVYLNPDEPIENRVNDLLERMTIEEKIGQMSQLDITVINTTGEQKDIVLDEEKARYFVKNHHVGSFINGDAAPADQWFEYMDKLTRAALEESRLGIPIIYGIDHMHGASYLGGSTIFPHSLNMGATFNRKHSYNMGWVTAYESADLAHHWIFMPVLDLGVEQSWPRLYETFGEDPYMASEMGVEFIKGLQGNQDIYPYKVAGTAKHFVAYSDPGTGWDRAPISMSEQEMHEIHRPPFQAAIESGVKTIMASGGDLNGVPVLASHEILTGLLRNELGFEGIVLTDWDDIGKLHNFHNLTPNYKEAAYKAVKAGIDVSMNPLNLNFNEAVLELYNEGRISEERIDQSVRRVLTLKFELGLFENPFPRNDRLDRVGSEKNRQKALAAAQESIVLLKNENNTLPLINPSHIILAGPTADNKRNLSGGWTLAWQGAAEENYPEDMHTVYTALLQEFPDASIDLIRELPEEFNTELEEHLNSADAIIYVGGEEPYTEFLGNIKEMNLPRKQQDEIAILAKSDSPLTLILVQGRPRIITDLFHNLDAFIHAGLPGFEGAEAIANLLSGKVSPSGKLPFSYPQYTGHYLNYNHKKSDVNFFNPNAPDHIDHGSGNTNLYGFGYGLSYTTFKYSDLTLSADQIRVGESITAQVTVTNTGDVEAMEPVLWFLRNRYGSTTRPVSELKYFEKINLKPGESTMLSFEIIPEESLWYPDRNGKKLFESGEFILMVDDHSLPFHLIH